MANQTLDIVINAQDKTSSGFSSAEKSVKGFGDQLENLKPAFTAVAKVGAVAFTALGAIAISSIKTAIDSQADMAVATQTLSNSIKSLTTKQLEAQYGTKNFATAMDSAVGKMNEVSEAAIKLGFDDEATAKSFAKLSQVTKDTGQAQKEIGIAMDLARAKGISLEDATQKIIMVHAGATKELKAFGIAVDETATPMQNLASIQASVAGQSEAASKTAAVQIEVLKLRMENLSQVLGDKLLPFAVKFLEALSGLITYAENWDTHLASVKERLNAIYKYFEDMGLIAIFRDMWAEIAAVWRDDLLPALTQWWAAMQPLMPFFELFAKVLGVIFLAAIVGIIKFIQMAIIVFMELLTIATNVSTYFAGAFKAALDYVSKAIESVYTWVVKTIDVLDRLWESMKKFGGSAMSSVSGLFGGQKVNDAIITPNGRVITPAQDDYIFATKNPASLGGGTGSSPMVININGGNYLSETAASEFGAMLVDQLRVQFKM